MLAVRGPRVIVEPENQTLTERDSGIITIESYAPDVIGTVIYTGHVQEVAVGDVVVFSPFAGLPLEYEGRRYLILDEDELMATWE